MNLLIDAVLRVNKAANDALDKVNDLGNWTDGNGITHIHVFDLSKEYRLVDGVWVEATPF
jgi:hypothetical protein